MARLLIWTRSITQLNNQTISSQKVSIDYVISHSDIFSSYLSFIIRLSLILNFENCWHLCYFLEVNNGVIKGSSVNSIIGFITKLVNKRDKRVKSTKKKKRVIDSSEEQKAANKDIVHELNGANEFIIRNFDEKNEEDAE